MDKIDRPNNEIILRAAKITLLTTAIVVLIKAIGTYLSGSVSVLAETLQSLTDVVVTLMTLVAIKIAQKPPDASHPSGHGKAELLSSLFQMIVIVLTAAAVTWKAGGRLLDPEPFAWDAGLVALLIAAIIDLFLMRYVLQLGKANGSPALLGEVEHLRSDLFATAGISVGLLAYAITGWRFLDPLLAIAFTLAGTYFAIRRLGRVLHELMDGALPENEVELVKNVLQQHPDVKSYHKLQTRKVGTRRVVTLHVQLEDELSFVTAHDLSEEVESEISRALGFADVTVHFEPYHAELAHRKSHHPEG